MAENTIIYIILALGVSAFIWLIVAAKKEVKRLNRGGK